MTTERIDIVIREDGSRVVKRNLEEIGNKSQNTASQLRLLKGALAGLVTGVIANELRQLTSQWTDLNSRIRIATGSQGQANAVMERLQEIAKRNYADLNVTAEAYLRNAASLTELGFSTKQQIDFTEALSNALTVSGAKAERAESVTNALSKAIASGSLRGENLNTVLESGGRVAEALAQGLGVGVNELRKLGTEGKLTSDVVLPALNSQLEKLREEADSMPATINDAFVNLRTQLMVTVGSFSDLSGASSGVVQWIDWIRITIEELTPELLNVARAMTGTLAAQDDLTEGGKLLASTMVVLLSVFGSLANALKNTVGTAFAAVGNQIGGIAAAIGAALDGEFSMAGEILAASLSDTGDIVVASSYELRDALISDTTDTIEKLYQIWDEGARNISDVQRQLAEPLSTEQSPINLVNPAEEKKLKNVLENQKKFLDGLLQEKAALELAASANIDYADALVQVQINQLAAQGGLEGFGDAARDAVSQVNALKAEMEAMANVQKDVDRILSDIETPLQVHDRQLERIMELYDMGRLTAEQYAAAVRHIREELVDAEEQLKPAADEMSVFLKRAQENAQDILARSIADGFRGGFDDVRQQFATLLIDMAAQFAASKIFDALGKIGSKQPTGIGGENGGGFFSTLLSGAGAFFAGKFADGGSFTVPGSGGTDSRLAMMRVTPGERVSVATPAQAAAGAGARPISMHNTFILPPTTSRTGLRETQAQIAATTFQATSRAARRN